MKNTNLTEGPIFSRLIRFALPVLLALFLQSMYGAIDLMVVGRFTNNAAHVSAVSTGSHVMMAVTVVVTGLSMGLTVFVGRKIGEGEKEEAGRIIGSGIALFVGLAVVLTAVLIACAPALAKLLNAPEAAFGFTVDYVVICSAGAVFIVAYNLLGSIFRGVGDSKMPLITVAIACVINIAGDFLLVAVFGMGTAGAAVATVFAQAASVALSFFVIRKRQLPFKFSRKCLRPDCRLIGEIVRLGTPIALQDLLVNISFLVITSIVNAIHVDVSAGVGVAERMCGFLMLVPSAYMQAMSAFVAQNMGAGRSDRARRALWYGIASSLAVGLVMAYATYFHGDIMASIFVRDTNVILAAFEYLKAYAIDCMLVSFLFCFIGYFNGVGSTMFVMLQGIVGAFGVRLPVSSFMSKRVPVSIFHIGLATPASTVVQIVLCLAWFFYIRKKQKENGDYLRV